MAVARVLVSMCYAGAGAVALRMKSQPNLLAGDRELECLEGAQGLAGFSIGRIITNDNGNIIARRYRLLTSSGYMPQSISGDPCKVTPVYKIRASESCGEFEAFNAHELNNAGHTFGDPLLILQMKLDEGISVKLKEGEESIEGKSLNDIRRTPPSETRSAVQETITKVLKAFNSTNQKNLYFPKMDILEKTSIHQDKILEKSGCNQEYIFMVVPTKDFGTPILSLKDGCNKLNITGVRDQPVDEAQRQEIRSPKELSNDKANIGQQKLIEDPMAEVAGHKGELETLKTSQQKLIQDLMAEVTGCKGELQTLKTSQQKLSEDLMAEVAERKGELQTLKTSQQTLSEALMAEVAGHKGELQTLKTSQQKLSEALKGAFQQFENETAAK